jgi:NitT/TauT family transport system permease protein
MLWFGLGTPSILFVLVHSVLWPVALGALSGFASVSPTLRMSGRIMGLKGPAFAFRLLLPAALPSVVTGLKTGWAVAWRTLIAAELVFGVSSGSGGLGWFIYEKKNQLEIPSVFAGLLMVILIGVVVEYLVFGVFERRTLMRWGMK